MLIFVGTILFKKDKDLPMLVAVKKITVEEFRQMEFEGEDAYYELINGEIMQKGAPSPLHQEVFGELFYEIKSFIKKKKLGKIYSAPIDVFLNEHNAVQPDILFIANKNLKIIDYKEGILGVPDLVVEIISPGSVNKDRNLKKTVYQNVGVKEFWLVDPNNTAIEVFINKKNGFELIAFAAETGKVHSEILKGFELDIQNIFPAT